MSLLKRRDRVSLRWETETLFPMRRDLSFKGGERLYFKRERKGQF